MLQLGAADPKAWLHAGQGRWCLATVLKTAILRKQAAFGVCFFFLKKAGDVWRLEGFLYILF